MTTYIVFFTVLALFMVGAMVFANNFMRKREVAEMKDLVSGKSTKKKKVSGEESGSLLKDEKLGAREMLAQSLLGKDMNQRLRDYIE